MGTVRKLADEVERGLGEALPGLRKTVMGKLALAVRRFAGRCGPVFGVSVPVAVPPSLRLSPPPALPAPVAWARAA